MKELGGVFSDKKHGHLLSIMITKLEEYLEIFQAEDFHDVVISAKSIDPLLVIDAYTEISKRFDYPLHLGVTHAGPKETGTIRSVVPLGHLLRQRHRRHDPHQLRQRPEVRGRGRAGAALRARPADARRRGADRLPHLRPHPGGPVQARAGRPQATGRGDQPADQGGGHGLHRERPRRVRRRRRRDLRRRPSRDHLRPGREGRQRPRGADPRRDCSRSAATSRPRSSAARRSWAKRRSRSSPRTRSANWAAAGARSRTSRPRGKGAGLSLPVVR